MTGVLKYELVVPQDPDVRPFFFVSVKFGFPVNMHLLKLISLTSYQYVGQYLHADVTINGDELTITDNHDLSSSCKFLISLFL